VSLAALRGGATPRRDRGSRSDKPGTAPAGYGAEPHTTGTAWKPGNSVSESGNLDTNTRVPRGSRR
jgi:hypothetical protein